MRKISITIVEKPIKVMIDLPFVEHPTEQIVNTERCAIVEEYGNSEIVLLEDVNYVSVDSNSYNSAFEVAKDYINKQLFQNKGK